MVTGIAHACYRVVDLDRSLRFYRDQLGLEPAFEFRDARGRRYGVYLRAGRRTFIELFETAQVAPASGQSYQHLCLEVDDLPATVAAWRSRGVDVGDPKLGLDQSWQAWLTDPDGNRIELHAYTPESWQAPHL